MKIGIIGIGLTDFRIHKEPFYNLAFEAAKKAVNDAGIDRGDIDSFVLGGYDNLGVGRTIANMYVAPAAGGYLRHEIRVADDAAFAVPMACMRILAGLSDICIVVGFSATSEIPLELVELQSLDPLFYRPTNLSIWAYYAIQKYAYSSKFGVDEERIAECVVRDRKNARNNPYAFKREELKLDDVLNSEYSVYPLRKLETAANCDGAVALILAEGTIAKRLSDSVVWINGFGWSNSNYYFEDFEKLPATKFAAEMALKKAKIDSIKAFENYEVMDLVSNHQLMILEALGLADWGKGYEIADSLNLNSSGGALSTNAYGTTGLFLLANAALKLREGLFDCSLVHAMSGYARRSCVSLLGV